MRVNKTFALYIAAKAPRPGVAKTRLAQDLGEAAALGLYRAFLTDMARRFLGTGHRLGWYVTPADAWLELGPLVDVGTVAPVVLVQGAGDWTERQRALFQGAQARGEDRTVLIASDSPQISSAIIDQAFTALDGADVVLGPTIDGGYSLIGMRGWHDVLQGVFMSTSTVLQEIVALVRSKGCSLKLLESTFDVDSADDLARLRSAVLADSELMATRSVLERLGWLDAPSNANQTTRVATRS